MSYVHTIVKQAIKSGRLVRPLVCEECGYIRRTWAHHDDYLKPLDVRWLCKPCHQMWHAAHLALNVEFADLKPTKRHQPKPGKGKSQQSIEANDLRLKDMQDLLRSGWTLKKVGEKYGLSRERVRQIAGSPHNYRPLLIQVAEQRLEEINRLRREGQSSPMIADALGISESSLYRLRSHVDKRGPIPLKHGTRTAYQRGCRCAECQKANREGHRRYVTKKRAEGFSGVTHGAVSTYHLGCKCESCLEIGRRSQRRTEGFVDRSESTRRAWQTRKAKYGSSGCAA